MHNSIFTFLTSQETAQQFLYQCYQNLPGIKTTDIELKSYENCQSFMYYLDHGRKLYKTGEQVDILFRPTLFFYGMSHFMKAVLLTKRPYYPESTKMLAHGVSSRKRKKKAYTFMDDEVKIQHHGLLPYYAKHILNMERWPFEKVKMKSMFSLIPELHMLFQLNHDEQLVPVGHVHGEILHFPNSLLDQYHVTAQAFIKRIKTFLPKMNSIEIEQNHISIELAQPFTDINNHPFFMDQKRRIYFPRFRDIFFPISKLIVHYLLLYNLSMLSRYEAGWWGDLMVTKAEIDYPFIVEYLQIAAQNVPNLFGSYFIEQTHLR